MKHLQSKSTNSGILGVFLSLESDLKQYLLRFLVSKEDIEDVLQEVYIRSAKVEKASAIRSPKAFLFKVAKNLALSELSRKSNRITSYIEDYERWEVLDNRSCLERNEIARQELNAFYRNVMQALPPKCQQVFILRKAYGLSHKEIARKLDISVSTVEKHLIKGVKRYEEYERSNTCAHEANTSGRPG